MRWPRRKRVSASPWLRRRPPAAEKSLRRRIGEGCVLGLLLLMLALMAVLSAYRCLARAYRRHAFRLYPQPLEKIELRTDGVLSAELLAPHLALPPHIDLMEIDLKALRQRLVLLEQVREAELARQFQDRSLQITLREEKPFARVRLQGKDGTEVLCVAASGKAFHGLGYDEQWLRSLPFLSGRPLQKRDAGTYHFGCGLGPIDDFLGRCREIYPEIYAQIRHLSLEHWDPAGEARWSRLELVARCAKKIIFFPDHWDEQLQRLRYLLQEDHLKKCFPLERIDLRSGPDVRVRLPRRRN
ncbi:MAG: hypothetical protein LBF21_00555 [Puniceicoccales bacterium]|jgi:hypothetical protein|nr:hypothetical protein [Puniceicoccales bacterium]